MSSPILCDGCQAAEAAFLVGNLTNGDQTAACLHDAPALFRGMADSIETALGPRLADAPEEEAAPESEPAEGNEPQTPEPESGDGATVPDADEHEAETPPTTRAKAATA